MTLLAPDQTTKHRHFVRSKVLIRGCARVQPFPIAYLQRPALWRREHASADGKGP